MNQHLLPLLAGITAVAAGCTLAPKYAQPQAPVPATWPTGPAYAQPESTIVSTVPDLPWQEFFSDEKLCQVIATALTNNRDLRLAVLNVERARAMYGIQRAESLPSKLRHGHIIEDMERQLIEKTLRECAGHRARTAEALGIGVRTLSLKLKQWREQEEARRRA